MGCVQSLWLLRCRARFFPTGRVAAGSRTLIGPDLSHIFGSTSGPGPSRATTKGWEYGTLHASWFVTRLREE